MVLVSVLGTALLTSWGISTRANKKLSAQQEKFLTREDHEVLCALRGELAQKDVTYIKERLDAIRADVDLLVRRNGGR